MPRSALALVAALAVALSGCTPVKPTPTTPPTSSATTTLSPSVEPTTTPPPSSPPSATTVPSTSMTTTTPSTPTPGPVAYPAPATTGVPANVALTEIAGNVTAPAGTVIRGKRITGHLSVAGHGVVIENSHVVGGIDNASGRWAFTVINTTIGDETTCRDGIGIGSDHYTATNVKILGFGDGFRGSADFPGDAKILIRDSFVRLCSRPGFHSDGYQGYHGPAGATLHHNTFDQSGVADATAPIFNSDGSAAITVTDNLVLGGGYSLRIYDVDGQHSTVQGNRVVDGSWEYGPVNSSCSNLWSGNTVVRLHGQDKDHVNGDGTYRVAETVRPLACTG